VNTHTHKTPQQFIIYIHAARKFAAFLRHAAIISVLFSTKCQISIILMFSINHALQSKYQPHWMKVIPVRNNGIDID
jgi:hypothetical protein